MLESAVKEVDYEVISHSLRIISIRRIRFGAFGARLAGARVL